MFCIYCGKEIPDNSVFCCFCGKTVFTGETSPQSPQERTYIEPSLKIDCDVSDEGNIKSKSSAKNKSLLIGWVITAVALLAVVGILLYPKISGFTKSTEVKNVEALISSIGTVDDSSEKCIAAAEDAYNDLSADDKSKVSNYNVLIDAEKTYAIKK